MRKTLFAAAVLGIAVFAATAARALINPTFTPVTLTEQADMILLLKFKSIADGKATAEIVKTLKGKPGATTVTIDLTVAASPEHGKAVGEMITAVGDGPALLFTGKGEREEPVSKLHLGGKWVSLDPNAKGSAWGVDSIDSHMEATWAGGTDMLLRCTELILAHPNTRVPVTCSGGWADPVEAGKVAGKVRFARAVDIAGKGSLVLFVASDAGDRVFAWDAKDSKFNDITDRMKLGSKSAAAAWGDFNGDGLLDLASADGKALRLWLQAADGSFAASDTTGAPTDGCVGLSAIDTGIPGRAGLVWTPPTGAPSVLVPDKEKAGSFTTKPLAGADLKEPGPSGASLVADFDGDNLPDIIRPFAKRSLFYAGKGAGEFAPGVPCPVALGSGRADAFLGDFDADGRIDIHTVAEDCPRLWQNGGGGKFADFFGICGEITYISKPGAIVGNACDINNDGRRDVYLGYSEMAPQVFFNRGFRSFGHAHRPIDLSETGNMPDSEQGQQAGIVADLTGDGLQDMAMVLLDGRVFLLAQATGGDPGLAVRVALAPGGKTAGPVMVSARNDRMALGTWTVSPGTSEAFFGREDPGEVTITWQIPGSSPESKKFTMEGKGVRFVIGAK
ncbi:MAG: VCBS repeat-containing protein [Planctomycetota bacterium]